MSVLKLNMNLFLLSKFLLIFKDTFFYLPMNKQVSSDTVQIKRFKSVESNHSDATSSSISPPLVSGIDSKRLFRSFYNVDAIQLANQLLGKILVRRLDNGAILKGKIVETESYLGFEDKACHTYQGKRTPAKEPMYMQPGTTYVYMTYGIYHCFNISSKEDGAVVLIRAVEPIQGIQIITENRKIKVTKSHTHCKSYQLHELCNGPSKLCLGFNLTKVNSNAQDLCSWSGMWIEESESGIPRHIVACPRIGIDSAGLEWASKPLRFYIFGNPSVSKRNKSKEAEILQKLASPLIPKPD